MRDAIALVSATSPFPISVASMIALFETENVRGLLSAHVLFSLSRLGDFSAEEVQEHAGSIDEKKNQHFSYFWVLIFAYIQQNVPLTHSGSMVMQRVRPLCP